jgi:hypothetical protein
MELARVEVTSAHGDAHALDREALGLFAVCKYRRINSCLRWPALGT